MVAWRSVLLALGVVAFGAAAAAIDPAFAQEAMRREPQLGWIGLGGMIAGLIGIVFGVLHRRSISLAERIHRLETDLEIRDDRIWSLEEKLARTTVLVDGQDDFVLREDAAGRVTHASPAVCALMRRGDSDVVGRPLALDAIETTAVTTSPDGARAYDQQIATDDGAKWIAWKEISVRNSAGEIVEVQRTGRDITARVETGLVLANAREHAEAASRAKSRFLATVSHEVRTPLNGILGMTGLLLDTPLSPEQQTYARAVKSSGEALLGLIEEILDFSKAEAGKIEIDAVPFDLIELVTAVAELLAPRAQEKGIEIATLFAKGLPAQAVGDAPKLRQVLLNLAGNAVKFTELGGVAILVERDGDRVRFAIEDTGPGIEPESQRRIFEEFEQGDGTLARRHGGTGLGLAIASRIVEHMGGEIVLESRQDGGAHFSFSVPLPEAEGTPASEANFAGAEILLLSPSPVVGPLLSRQLEQWGAQVTLAESEDVALSLLPEKSWSHCLIDRAFGYDSALSLAARSRAHAAHRHLLLTPQERSELAAFANAGLASYLIKPVRAASLAARLLHPEQAIAGAESTAVASARTGRRLSVLVAEDNDINALLMQALLTRMGCRVTVVGDGAVAVNAVANAQTIGAPYDLVLMDLHLPAVDGLEATRRIRALGSAAGKVPVIALTANVSDGDRKACFQAGMNAFLSKPVDRAKLEDAIAAACGVPEAVKSDAA
jgi:signal transduction histidine kinase/DNA-binding response OmpR family regulator